MQWLGASSISRNLCLLCATGILLVHVCTGQLLIEPCAGVLLAVAFLEQNRKSCSGMPSNRLEAAASQ